MRASTTSICASLLKFRARDGTTPPRRRALPPVSSGGVRNPPQAALRTAWPGSGPDAACAVRIPLRHRRLFESLTEQHPVGHRPRSSWPPDPPCTAGKDWCAPTRVCSSTTVTTGHFDMRGTWLNSYEAAAAPGSCLGPSHDAGLSHADRLCERLGHGVLWLSGAGHRADLHRTRGPELLLPLSGPPSALDPRRSRGEHVARIPIKPRSVRRSPSELADKVATVERQEALIRTTLDAGASRSGRTCWRSPSFGSVDDARSQSPDGVGA
jgi:hypothetical protein